MGYLICNNINKWRFPNFLSATAATTTKINGVSLITATTKNGRKKLQEQSADK